MSRRRELVRADERGASLVLAIAFMVVIGAIAMSTLAMITSGLNNRRDLDGVRDRQYGAEAAAEYAIASVRTLNASGGGPALESCSSALPASYTVDGRTFHVDCQNAPTVTYAGLLQRNVIFTACLGTSACSGGSEIVRAQVNYEAVGSGTSPLVVTRTWIQSWSVNA